MSTADRRVTDLLDRWQRSVELHQRYLDLDDEAYGKVQAWPPHQRPTRWVLELASAKLAALRQLHDKRQGASDSGFAEALEMMGFLQNLLGAEHIERFVPLARENPQAPSPGSMSKTVAQALVNAPERTAPAGQAAANSAAPGRGRHPEKTTTTAKSRRGSAGTRRPRKPPSADAAPTTSTEPSTEEQVIADAARFLSWGREWPTLAGLIARLANRPAEPEIWEILRRNRQAIQARAAKGAGSATRR
jgi:hypothetical protein